MFTIVFWQFFYVATTYIYLEKVLNLYRGNAHCSIEKLNLSNSYSAFRSLENLTHKKPAVKNLMSLSLSWLWLCSGSPVATHPREDRTTDLATLGISCFLCTVYIFCTTYLVCLFLGDFSENFYLKFWMLYRSPIHEHTILLRFPGIILIVLRLEVLYGFLNTFKMGYSFPSGFPPFSFTVYSTEILRSCLGLKKNVRGCLGLKKYKS